MKREEWLVGEDAGDLQLDDEGRGDGVGGDLNEDSICKRNKKVSIIINDSKIFLTFHTINATR